MTGPTHHLGREPAIYLRSVPIAALLFPFPVPGIGQVSPVPLKSRIDCPAASHDPVPGSSRALRRCWCRRKGGSSRTGRLVTAFLQERWWGRTGRVAVQIGSNTALALDLAHAEPAARLVDYLQEKYRRSLGEVNALLFRVLLSPYAPGENLALLEDSMALTTSFVLVPGSELEKWVLTGLRRSRGPVPLSEASALTRLDLTRHQIVDVSPLVLLTGLESLGLSENRIVDVSPLASLSGLEHLEAGWQRRSSM